MNIFSKDFIKSQLLYLAWVQSIVATVGSLFFSEVMKLPPCVLCWYQRILMYPLIFILGTGILLEDKKVTYYALPLSITGFAIALYHNLLYYNIIPEAIVPCSTGVSCTTRQIEWFGFITIPLLSLIAFTFITFALFFYKKNKDE